MRGVVVVLALLAATAGLAAAAFYRPAPVGPVGLQPAAMSSTSPIEPSSPAAAALAPAGVRPGARMTRGGAATKKKGVSTYEFSGNAQAIRDSRAGWYYNWSQVPSVTSKDVEFVPMIWGSGSVNPAMLSEAKTQGTVLLGFNEPDSAKQSNLTPEKALTLWPQLTATGLRLGSPAPAVDAATPGGWLDRFMAGASERGYRVDFIALHWYGRDFSPAAVAQLQGYLQAVWERYHKPIWLTEFALIRYQGARATVPTQPQQVAFVQAATAMLEHLPYVERYAWFALPAKDLKGTGLYRDGTTPTPVGAAYRDAG
jgi:hypothetical protein